MNKVIIIQAIGIAFASIGVYAGPELLIPPNDQILALMQSIGFPAWAGVVAWGVMRITSLIKDMSNRLDDHIADADKRIMKIELYLQLKPPPDHFNMDNI